MAKLILVDGTEQPIEPKNGTDFKLKELQKAVNGYIEIINLNDGTIMVVNEDGKYIDEPNEKATEIAQEHRAIFDGDFISGDVIVCKDEEVR